MNRIIKTLCLVLNLCLTSVSLLGMQEEEGFIFGRPMSTPNSSHAKEESSEREQISYLSPTTSEGGFIFGEQTNAPEEGFIFGRPMSTPNSSHTQEESSEREQISYLSPTTSEGGFIFGEQTNAPEEGFIFGRPAIAEE